MTLTHAILVGCVLVAGCGSVTATPLALGDAGGAAGDVQAGSDAGGAAGTIMHDAAADVAGDVEHAQDAALEHAIDAQLEHAVSDVGATSDAGGICSAVSYHDICILYPPDHIPCIRGCKDDSGATVTGTACTVKEIYTGDGHQRTNSICVEECNSCPPANADGSPHF